MGEDVAELRRVLADISRRDARGLLPADGPPLVAERFSVPAGLSLFYELCGGVTLFAGAPFAWRVVGPRELVPASPRLLDAETAEEIARDDPDELTNGCFVFAETGPGSTDSLIVVDLHPDRAGRYYHAFWDTYGLVGEMPVIAVSVAEVLRQILATDGDMAEMPDLGYGDAYDPQ
jgi:antitoxin YokJ